MKKAALLLVFVLSNLLGHAGNPKIDYEWFALGGNFVYSIEDGYTGLNGKLSFPLSSKSVSFVLQGTLFPSQMQFSENTLDEVRSKVNIQITPIRTGKFSTYFQVGFDNGTWRRNYEVLNSTLGTSWKVDESMMFGAGMNYDYKGVRFYTDWMYMPQIYSNHVGVGMHILFFEQKLYRRYYMQRRRRGSVWNFKLFKKRKGNSIKL